MSSMIGEMDGKVDMDKAVFLFELDDLLFPKRDYLLQVYYLFANFVEFTEGRALSKSMITFMKSVYEARGEDVVLSETLTHFNLGAAYRENFERLMANAHLPLKLFLLDHTKILLQSLFALKKQVGILTDGNPVEQLNKLKHMDWQELAPFLPAVKIFFLKELQFRNIETLAFLQETYKVKEEDICIVERL